LVATAPQGVTVFDRDDAGFFDWLDQNPDGYFLNTARNPTPQTHVMLHLSSCPHIGREDRAEYTRKRVKLCSGQRVPLEQWAVRYTGDKPALCRSCFS